MTVNSYLKDLGDKLILTQSEKSGIDTSISTLEKRMHDYFNPSIIEGFKFGSFTRKTILPRSVDEKSDVDYMVVFADGGEYTPQTYLDRLKRFAEKCYKTSEVHQSSPTVVLELNHIKFELVPAYKEYSDYYYIPDGKGGWMYTSPNSFNTQLTEANNNNNYLIKPVIRLLKYWNIAKNHRELSSYAMEERVAETMLYGHNYCTNYVDYLYWLLDDFYGHFYHYGYSSSSGCQRICSAKDSVQDAVGYENNGQTDKAMSTIMNVFPEV